MGKQFQNFTAPPPLGIIFLCHGRRSFLSDNIHVCCSIRTHIANTLYFTNQEILEKKVATTTADAIGMLSEEELGVGTH